MLYQFTRAELVALVEAILVAEGGGEEITALLQRIEDSLPVPDGYVTDLIFWSTRHGLSKTPTAEEIVDKTLSYRPILL